MKTIYKYPLTGINVQTVQMPVGAKILHAAYQANTIMLLALVDDNAPLEERKIGVWGTGHEVDQEFLKHIGTVVVDGFLFHVFEVGTKVASLDTNHEAVPVQLDNKPRRKKSSD